MTHGFNFVAKSVHRPLFLLLRSYVLEFAFSSCRALSVSVIFIIFPRYLGQ